ncbi:MAG TPA: M20/M25/M40 family metallo-hydrolase [Vicinamibacterales bacterium]|nr:M20/M25/M40 family metallo-hydrolase [Vicinamibacterales bacterium]
MRPAARVCSLAALFALLSTSSHSPARAQTTHPHHALTVVLEPATHRLVVADTLTMPAGETRLEFLLNSHLQITKSSIQVHEVPLGDVSPFFGINASGSPGAVPLKRYRMNRTPAGGVLTLEYSGAMDFGLSDQKEEYTRGFRETTGMVSSAGVFLSGGSFWYPHFGEDLLTFETEVKAPAGWHVISQGSGTSRDDQGVARWTTRHPMDEIYIVGGPLLVTRDRAGAVETLVYLHEQDEALASKYLTTTAQYLEMYEQLIGPYPYDKFALVENFWETGYGMPSFTLLGREVIRFPFILHSSYPHEILHNWWGNSVFVDYGSGNWAEGLTAYLADHLVQEQRRRGAEYRRAALQKYRDYVKDGRDFALTDFRSRDSAATEAVGYGKTLMTFHMLRRRMGDDRFKAMLARLYRDNKGRRASWADVERTSHAAAGMDLQGFFADWVARPGAPALEVRVEGVARRGSGYLVRGAIGQTQRGQPYHLEVPVVVQTDTGSTTHAVRLADRTAALEIEVPDRPLMLHVDPYFDVFRTLDPRETPPSISQIFGDARVLAVLPSSAPLATQSAYRELLKGWQTATHAIDIRLDSDDGELPTASSVWLLGRDNRLAASLFSKQAGLTLEKEALRIDGQALPATNHTVVAITRHPRSPDKVVGWIVVDPVDALPGLGRKLPHYGKYSYVGFEGTEPANTISGEWLQADSPMRIDLRGSPAADEALKPLPPDPAKPLAELPPAFSRTTMAETVATLTAPMMEGRGVGTKGLSGAAAFIAERFKGFGLAPGGDRGGYLQAFTLAKGPDGKPHRLVNVIGLIPGTRVDWKTQSVVVCAHYDHLGHGWPDVHSGDENAVHPGADDNASGVAVLLELARSFAAGEKPSRSILFIAFAGEEAGLAGSRHYVEAPSFPLGGLIGVINLDTVGRLFDQRISVLGTGTATEWQHIFRGAGFVTGVESRNIPDAIESSDHVPFVERGIPAVQVFTGAHADYHRPGDTADKIDGAGLVKVATFVREGVAYLAERPDPLTVTIKTTAAGAVPSPTPRGNVAPPRRASLGTIPDFAFQGPGVRAEGIVEGSPAAKAGLAAGDVLVRINDHLIANLQEYSNLLRTLQPGQTVSVVVQRGGKEMTVSVTLGER